MVFTIVTVYIATWLASLVVLSYNEYTPSLVVTNKALSKMHAPAVNLQFSLHRIKKTGHVQTTNIVE